MSTKMTSLGSIKILSKWSIYVHTYMCYVLIFQYAKLKIDHV